MWNPKVGEIYRYAAVESPSPIPFDKFEIVRIKSGYITAVVFYYPNKESRIGRTSWNIIANSNYIMKNFVLDEDYLLDKKLEGLL